MIKTTMLTPFELAQQQAEAGTLQLPSVSMGDKKIDYFLYQLSVHRFNLNIMAGGMTFKGVKFTDIKKYYGLKGRTAKDCVEQFDKIIADFKTKNQRN